MFGCLFIEPTQTRSQNGKKIHELLEIYMFIQFSVQVVLQVKSGCKPDSLTLLGWVLYMLLLYPALLNPWNSIWRQICDLVLFTLTEHSKCFYKPHPLVHTNIHLLSSQTFPTITVTHWLIRSILGFSVLSKDTLTWEVEKSGIILMKMTQMFIWCLTDKLRNNFHLCWIIMYKFNLNLSSDSDHFCAFLFTGMRSAPCWPLEVFNSFYCVYLPSCKCTIPCLEI